MKTGEAIRAALRPALIVGPFLGLTGFGLLILIALVGGEPVDGLIVVLLIGVVVALFLGLLIASPACFVGTAAMLLLSTKDSLWSRLPRWIAAGAVAGPALPLLIWFMMAGEADADWVSGVVVAVFGAILGALGGWLCRRIAAPRIAELDAVDASVFA